MKILLNNREEKFDNEYLRVSELLDLKKLTFRMRIIKINGILIPKDSYSETIIRNGDNVQVLYLMSGG
ncbi:MAG TPA: sulfur carrier protein ThiS [Bacteroidales bacterium]|nr:sulfur carrier protein ThiS [Bacteroidales bacterium]